MGRFILSKAHDWQLEHDDQDIRGWEVVDAAGNDAGTVQELIANTDSKKVESIVLDTGKEYPAKDVEIGDRVVYLEGYAAREGAEAKPVIKKYHDTRIRLGEGRGGYAAHEDVFRRHYDETYEGTENDYGYYAPAYEYGYTYGTNPTYEGRDYSAVEPELRRDYERHHGEGTFEKVKDAARHAFRHARH